MPAIPYLTNGNTYYIELFYLELQSQNKETEIMFLDDLAKPSQLSSRIQIENIAKVWEYKLPIYNVTQHPGNKFPAKLTYSTYNTNYLELERFKVNFKVSLFF